MRFLYAWTAELFERPVFCGGWGFPIVSMGKIHFTESVFKVLLVEDLDSLKMAFERFLDDVRQNGDAVLCPFAVTNSDVIGGKVDILDSKSERLHESQARTIEEGNNNFGCAAHVREDIGHFVSGKDDREFFGAFGPFDLTGIGQGFFEDLPACRQTGL